METAVAAKSAMIVMLPIVVVLGVLVLQGLVVMFRNPAMRSGIAGAFGILGILALGGLFFVAKPTNVTYQFQQAELAKSQARDRAEKKLAEQPLADGSEKPKSDDKLQTHLQVRGKSEAVGVARPPWVVERDIPGVNTRRFVVHAGPEASAVKLEQEVHRKLAQRVDEYLQVKFGAQAPALIRPSVDYIRTALVQETFTETQMKMVGTEDVPVSDQWFLVNIDDAAAKDFEVRWHESVASDRIRVLGAGFAAVLLCLGTIYSYLKADLATAGQYRNRLRAAAVAFLLLVLGGAVLYVA